MAGYDHARKVGNRGDVWKHAALLSVVDALTFDWESGRTFRYLETHSGAGFFQLRETGEWQQGIGRRTDSASEIAHPYFDLCRDLLDQRHYLGSWRLVRKFLLQHKRGFQLDLYDTSSAVSNMIWPQIERRELQHVRFHQLDGYGALENARDFDLVLVDPPYAPRASREWPKCRKALTRLRDSGTSYLLWYPIAWPSEPQKLVDTAQTVGFEILWAKMGERRSQNIKGCGLIAGRQAREALEAASSVLEKVAGFLDGTLHLRSPKA